MKVSELAKEFKTSTDKVLDKLRTLHLKAKDGDQDLSKAVVTVLKTELLKDLKENAQKAESAARAPRRRRISDIVLSGKDLDTVFPDKDKKKGKGVEKDEQPKESKKDAKQKAADGEAGSGEALPSENEMTKAAPEAVVAGAGPSPV
ncbi:MAG TPA: hypothetical protein P5246_06415, partial [Candidatus Omnitrophota bacterium]|nr:hypothetical protein [Candidatus Omnitrophota bacterium]